MIKPAAEGHGFSSTVREPGQARRKLRRAPAPARAAFPGRRAVHPEYPDEEHDADQLAHAALERLDRTFITPFDREDIHELVGGLDDIVDTIDALAKRFPLYHVTKMESAFQKQTDTLVKSTVAVSEAVHRLRKSRKLSELADQLIEIHRLENVGDDQNHAAMSELFSGVYEPLEVMKWKELYD
jgi:uncharacterized protein Yka (UPF0111/DUF47 family)